MKKPRKLRVWQWVLLSLSALGFLVFLAPVFGGILGLANGGAMLGFLALAGAVYWWQPLLRLLRRLWSRLWGKVLLLITGLGLAALLVLLAVLSCLVISRMRAVPERDCPTLVVLGCQVRGERPSLQLSYRIGAAEAYLKAHPDAVAILSGGRGPGEKISEAECMYRSLTARGIDGSRLYLEDQSTVTRENLANSAELCRREGLEGPLLLVSNDFHIYRAQRMAADQALDAEALAAPSNWYSKPTYVLREALALVKYGLTK